MDQQHPAPVEGARWIALSKTLFVLVDAADFDWLNSFNWHITGAHTRFPYATMRIEKTPGRSRFLLMHRLIMKCPTGLVVDHINGNTLNNRRSNLRIATSAQNSKNAASHADKKTSGYKGVTWHRSNRRWQAAICVNYKQTHLGYYDTEIEAAKAYDEAAKRHHGEFARINFKEDSL